MALVRLIVTVKVSVSKDEHYILDKSDVSSELTWDQFFAENKIAADPKVYYIRGSVYTAYLGDRINLYYKKFTRQMASYKVTLCRKPSHLVKHEKDLEEAIRKSLNLTKRADDLRVVYPTSPTEQDDNETPHCSKRVRFLSPPVVETLPRTQQLGNVHRFSDFCDEHERGGEDTQSGNNVTDTERTITDDIRQHFQNRVSNQDILNVRTELKGLKRERNYFRLTRIISFTAGFLENTFLLDQ